MAIERDGPEMQIVCDATGERYPQSYDRDDFYRMVADAKADGWRVVLEKGEWRHYRPMTGDVEFDPLELDED